MSPPDRPPPRSRGNPSLGDMLRSIVVLGAIVAAVALFTAYLREDPPDPAAAVDYQEITEEARASVDFPVLAPDELAEGWRSNNARVDPGDPPAWHLGVLTDDEDYIGVEQSGASRDDMVEKHAEGSRPDGSARVAGQRWSVRTGGGDTTYVRRDGGVTVLVTGDAPREQIETYMGTLSAR